VALTDASGKEVWRAGDMGTPTDWRVTGTRLTVLDGMHLHELSLDTGARQGRVKLARPGSHFAIGKDAFYVAAQGYRLWSYDPEHASEQWALSAENQDLKVALRFRGHLEFADGLTFWANSDGKLAAVGLNDGKVQWTYPVKDFLSPLLVRDGRIHFAAPGVGLVSLEAKTGKELWKEALPDADRFLPVALQNKVVFWSSDGWFVEPE
jgi:outer membrane protein assembly factor BamB